MPTTAATIQERTTSIDDIEIFYREADIQTATPTLYIHGVPSHSIDWVPFLERTGGVALDLPGFGRSSKPPHFEYSIGGYDRLIESFITRLGWDRFSLVVHDWGAVGLATAQRLADRLDRLVIINAVPFLPGYRWHPIARVWRTPLIGELAMGFTTKSVGRLAGRKATGGAPAPAEWFDAVWANFDHGTQRAILKLYRSAPGEVLAAAGSRLDAITAPALVIWGASDPFIPVKFAQDYVDALPKAQLELLPSAGHWPWNDNERAVSLVAEFLIGPPESPPGSDTSAVTPTSRSEPSEITQ